jgi:hypothetical protein
LVKEFTSSSTLSGGINILKDVYGFANEMDVMKEYKAQILFETYRSILGNRTPQNNLEHLNHSLSSVLRNRDNDIDLLEGKGLQLCEELLRNSTSPFFKARAVVFTPSRNQIKDLYDDNMMVTYTGNQQHKNLPKLFAKLKNSPMVSAMLARQPDFNAALTELQRSLVERLNRYSSLPENATYNSRELIDESIRYLETYVARVVYADQSRVTSESIERSLIQLAATVGSDLSHGCGRGLAGRTNSLLISLTSSVGNDLQDNVIEFQKNCLERVFLEIPRYRDSTENSSMAVHKGEVSDFLGITESENRKNYNQLSVQAQEILQYFSTFYNPITIYHNARTFFSDKFWTLNKENENDSIYELFAELGFTESHEELDRKYRVNGDAEKSWQYTYFQQDLPKYLVPFLISKRILSVKMLIPPLKVLELVNSFTNCWNFNNLFRRGQICSSCATFKLVR